MITLISRAGKPDSMNAAFGKYLAALLLFGSNGVVASMILLSSYDIVLLRTCIGSLLLLILFFITGQRLDFFKNKRSALFLTASGACMGSSWMFPSLRETAAILHSSCRRWSVSRSYCRYRQRLQIQHTIQILFSTNSAGMGLHFLRHRKKLHQSRKH